MIPFGKNGTVNFFNFNIIQFDISEGFFQSVIPFSWLVIFFWIKFKIIIFTIFKRPVRKDNVNNII